MTGFRVVSAVMAGLLATMTGCTVDRAGGTAAEEVRVLTFAQGILGDPPPQLRMWADEVGRLTDGTVQVRFQDGWRAGETTFELGTVQDVQSGQVDLAWVGARVLDRVGVTGFQALLAPLLVDSHDLQRAVFEDGIPDEMLREVSDVGVEGIAVLPGPMRKVLGVTKSFVTPSDFTGSVVGMQDSALAEATLRALGASPQLLPTSGKLDGLDAYEQQLGSIVGNGYTAQSRAVTSNVNLWPRPLVILASKSAYDSLDEQQRQALRDAGRRVMVDALVGAAQEDDEAAAIVCASGVSIDTVSADGLAAFREAVEPVYSSLRKDPVTAGFLDRILALKASVGVPPDDAGCGSHDDASEAIPNGIYEHLVTGEDVERLCEPGDPEGDAVRASQPSEGGNTVRLRVSGDRLVQSEFPVGRPDLEQVGWTGTYRAYRDTLELRETGHNEAATLSWALAGSELRLSDWPFDDCGGQLVWVSKPWIKVG